MDKAVTIGANATYPIRDEDNLVSDDNRALATQQSIKAYVDAAVSGTAGAAATAAAAEIDGVRNYVEMKQELTETGAITAGKNLVELNHIDTAIEATIEDLANHPGLLTITNTSASGTAAHTVTAAAGTFDGSNEILTLNAPGESIVLWIDADGDGTVALNVDDVGLSTAG